MKVVLVKLPKMACSFLLADSFNYCNADVLQVNCITVCKLVEPIEFDFALVD